MAYILSPTKYADEDYGFIKFSIPSNTYRPYLINKQDDSIVKNNILLLKNWSPSITIYYYQYNSLYSTSLSKCCFCNQMAGYGNYAGISLATKMIYKKSKDYTYQYNNNYFIGKDIILIQSRDRANKSRGTYFGAIPFATYITSAAIINDTLSTTTIIQGDNYWCTDSLQTTVSYGSSGVISGTFTPCVDGLSACTWMVNKYTNYYWYNYNYNKGSRVMPYGEFINISGQTKIIGSQIYSTNTYGVQYSDYISGSVDNYVTVDGLKCSNKKLQDDVYWDDILKVGNKYVMGVSGAVSGWYQSDSLPTPSSTATFVYNDSLQVHRVKDDRVLTFTQYGAGFSLLSCYIADISIWR